jgi:LPS-assembly protein
VQGREVFLADEAQVDLNARSAELRSAVIYLKERPANPDAPKSGANALILRGERARQLADGTYQAEAVRLTPCDCAGDPDYEILADHATLHGDRADLSGAHLRLLGATLPLFPISLPLTQRQSGLLAPQLGFGGVTGFGYAQPVFVTLGRSNDLTLTPSFFTGLDSSGSAALGARTVRRPGLGLEWRYAPAEGTQGSVWLDLFYDLAQHDSPAVPVVVPPGFAGEHGTAAGRGLGGVRGVAHLAHRTEGSAGVLALQGTVATDVLAVADAEPASLERAQDFLRTDLGAWRASGPLTVGADATFLQDVRITDGAHPDRRLFGPERRATFQRLPALFGQVAPIPAGPFTFSAEASAVQFAVFAGPDPQERATGFAPTDRGAPGTPLGAGDFARAPGVRFDLSPRLSLSAPPSLPVDLRLELGGRLDSWAIEGTTARDRTRAYALAGARAALPLERAFGEALHRVEPAFEVRALSRPLQTGGLTIGDPADAGGDHYSPLPDAAQQGLWPGLSPRDPAADAIQGVPAARRAYDEIDGAAPATGAVEAVFSLSQSLWTRPGRVAVRTLRLDVQQDALLWARGARARLGEGSVFAVFQRGPLAASGALRFDWTQRAISQVSASLSLRDGRGDEVHAGTLLLRGSSSERLRAGIDELFSAARLASSPGDLAGGAGGGASAPIPLGLRASYEVSRYIGPLRADLADWTHTGALVYETSCRCAGLVLSVAIPLRQGRLFNGPVIHLVLDLKSLGSFATF